MLVSIRFAIEMEGYRLRIKSAQTIANTAISSVKK
jgi:hypothetical protein